MQNVIEASIPLDSILLDFENARLPGAIPANQEEALDILGDDDVGNLSVLAHSIVNAGGLFPFEKIVLMPAPKEKGKYIVLEGNRRVAACKAIRDRAKLGALAKRIPEINAEQFKTLGLESISAVIVAKREDADMFIANKHQGIGIKGWSPKEQRKFLSAKYLDDGLSVEQIVQRTLCDKRQVLQAIQTELTLRIIFDRAMMGWNDAQYRALEKTRGLTTFERILWSKAGKSNLKLRVDGPEVFTSLKATQFLGALKVIASRCLIEKNAEGYYVVNSRNVNTDTDIQAELERLPVLEADAEINITNLKSLKATPDHIQISAKPTPKQAEQQGASGQTTGIDINPQSADTDSNPGTNTNAKSGKGTQDTKEETTAKRKKKIDTFIPLTCTINCPKIRRLTSEFNIIHTEKNIALLPYAYTFLLRGMLEHCLVYLLENSDTKAGKNHYGEYAKKHSKASLTNLIDYCVDPGKELMTDELRNALKSYKKDGNVTEIHGHVHGKDQLADGKSALSHYNKLYGVLSYILNDSFNNKKNDDAAKTDKPIKISRK